MSDGNDTQMSWDELARENTKLRALVKRHEEALVIATECLQQISTGVAREGTASMVASRALAAIEAAMKEKP